MTLSFKDFIAKSDTDKKNLLKNISPKCFGIKGKWTDDLKRDMMNLLVNKQKVEGPCSLCIVGTLEQNYDPMQLTSNEAMDIMKNVMIQCGDAGACKK